MTRFLGGLGIYDPPCIDAETEALRSEELELEQTASIISLRTVPAVCLISSTVSSSPLHLFHNITEGLLYTGQGSQHWEYSRRQERKHTALNLRVDKRQTTRKDVECIKQMGARKEIKEDRG